MIIDRDNLPPLPERFTLCEECGAGFKTTLSRAAWQECYGCMRTRLEPFDEERFDWRQEYYEQVIHPIESALNQTEEWLKRFNTE